MNIEFLLIVAGLAIGVAFLISIVLMVSRMLQNHRWARDVRAKAAGRAWQRDLWEWQKQHPGEPFMKAVITDDEQVIVWNGPQPPEGLLK